MECVQIFPLKLLCALLGWIYDALSHSDGVTSFQGVVQHCQICHNCIRLLVQCEGVRTSAFCALKQTLHVGGDAYGLGHVKLLSGSACEFKMAAGCMRHLNEPVLSSCLALSLTVSAACASSPYCGS